MFKALAESFLTLRGTRRSHYFAGCGVTAEMVVRAYAEYVMYSDSSYEADDGYNASMDEAFRHRLGTPDFRNGEHRIQWDSIAADFHEFVLLSIRNEIATYA